MFYLLVIYYVTKFVICTVGIVIRIINELHASLGHGNTIILCIMTNNTV